MLGRPNRGNELEARILPVIVLMAAIVAAFALAGDKLGLGHQTSAAAPDNDAFVCAQDSHLELDCGGPAWSPVGFDDYRLTSQPDGYVCDTTTGDIDDAELDERLDSIAATGANSVRTWFLQSYTAGGTDFSGFQRVLDAASDRGLRVIPVLVNDLGDCEADGTQKDITFYERGYRMAGYGYPLSFHDYVERVASHFRNDPAIAFWQLVNEAQAPQPDGSCDETRAASALSAFAADMSATIRAIDPNHMIGLGPKGVGSCGTMGSDYGLVQRDVDICGMHQYEELADDTASSVSDGTASPEATSALTQCDSLGKPVVSGEIGVPSDIGPSGSQTGTATDSTLIRRADLLDSAVEAQASSGLDGALVWQRVAPDQPESTATAYDVPPGDPIDDLMSGWISTLSGG